MVISGEPKEPREGYGCSSCLAVCFLGGVGGGNLQEVAAPYQCFFLLFW